MAEEIRQAGVEGNPIPQPEVQSREARPVALPCDRTNWLSFGIVTAIALLVYLSTLAPNVTLEDSGILSVGAMYSGVPSPPGYPAWTIYSWLFVELLPFSNIAWRVAVGSAVATALACGLVAFMVSRCGPILFSETPAFVSLKPVEREWLRGVSGGVAGLILAFSHVVWENAVVAEIWALTLLLFVSGLCLITRWTFQPKHRWSLFIAFVLFGLTLTDSQEMIVALPGLVGAIIMTNQKLGRDLALTLLPLAAIATVGNQWSLWIIFPSKMNWPAMLAFAFVFVLGVILAIRTRGIASEWESVLLCSGWLMLGLALCLYVPIASMTNPPVNWGYPRTAEGFFHVLSRGQFERASPTNGLGVFGEQLLQFVSAAPRCIGWPSVILASLSIGSLGRMSRLGRRWMLGLFAVWICVGPVMVAELNPPPDRQARELIELYFAASYAILAVCAGVGMMWLGVTMSRAAELGPAQVLPRAE